MTEPYLTAEELSRLSNTEVEPFRQRALGERRAIEYTMCCDRLGNLLLGTVEDMELYRTGEVEVQDETELSEPEVRLHHDYLIWLGAREEAFLGEITEDTKRRISHLPAMPSRANATIREHNPCQVLQTLYDIDTNPTESLYHALCEIPLHGVYPLLDAKEFIDFLAGAQNLREAGDSEFIDAAIELRRAGFPGFEASQTSNLLKNVFSLASKAIPEEWLVDETFESHYSCGSLDLRLSAVQPYAVWLLGNSLPTKPFEYIYKMEAGDREIYRLEDIPEGERIRILPPGVFASFRTTHPEVYRNEVAEILIGKLPKQLNSRFLR
tara:strand:- start:1308 stop:2279 length:972 start_codon:yes stop_codon:yes gene_type:complete